MAFRACRALRPAVDRLDVRSLLSGLTPAQLTTAYGLNDIVFSADGQTVQGNGSGQTIALIEAYHDPYLAADLATFDATYNLPPVALAQINLAGSATNNGWAGEEALDVEAAHSIAPAAAIVVVEARSQTTKALLAAVTTAKTIPGVSVISMSWGQSEYGGQTGRDSLFTTPAGHIGITYVAASGDQGVQAGAEWPASSTNVLAVGGTTLFVNASGDYEGESTWTGTSGGTSRFEPEPAYEYILQSSGRRTTPDVSFDANPNTGLSTYTTNPATGQGSWEVVGGTSLGTPSWAAIIALADQGRALAGEGTLDGPSQTLPALYSLPSNDFHTVTSAGGGFRAETVATPGLGSPNGQSLINGLVSFSGTRVDSAPAIKKQSITKSKARTSGHAVAVRANVHPAPHALNHRARR